MIFSETGPHRPLLHIGYHKTGTTWLQRHGFTLLHGAERVHGPNIKAASNEIISATTATVGRLRALVSTSNARHPIVSYEKFSGDIMAGSPHQERTAYRLLDEFPDARILIVVRAQPEMVESLHAQYVNQGGTGSFATFLEGSAPGIIWDPTHLEYDRLVSVYLELFNESGVLVLPYELLRDRPGEFLSCIAELLDTTVAGEVTPLIVNPSLRGLSLDLLRSWNRLARRSRFNQNPPIPLPGAARMRRLMQALPPRPHVASSDSIGFSQRYAPSNQRLAESCDLTGWGYPGVA